MHKTAAPKTAGPESLDERMANFERELITAMLEQNHFSLTKTAEQLKISRHALRYRMQRLNIATGTETEDDTAASRRKTLRHEHHSVFLADSEVRRTCWRPGGMSNPATRERLIIFGAIGLVAVLVLVWAVFLRKSAAGGTRPPSSRTSIRPSRPKSGGPRWRRRLARAGETPPAAPVRPPHRPRNPTLAETGGLPPVRPEGPPEPQP